MEFQYEARECRGNIVYRFSRIGFSPPAHSLTRVMNAQMRSNKCFLIVRPKTLLCAGNYYMLAGQTRGVIFFNRAVASKLIEQHLNEGAA